jgi:hypothetical protein
MTDHDLATLVREHVRTDEPHFLMSSETAIALGRRTLVRRRARRGFAGVLVAAAAVAALPLMPWHGAGGAGDTTGIDPATATALKHYDAQRMRAIIDEHVRVALGHGLAGLGAPEFTVADGEGNALPEKYYDKASGMTLAFGATGDHRIRVELMHSGSEAEGDARQNCANDLADGTVFSCEVSSSGVGDVVTTRVTALRPLEMKGADWSVVTREELSTGVPVKGDPNPAPIDPADVYFARTVESVHSKTFLTRAEEIVRAPDLTTAERRWKVPVSGLQAIATDPELVIPEPPTGKNGCAWTMPGSDIRCAGNPSPGHN